MSPYLDNIETSGTDKKSLQSLCVNAFGNSSAKNLYSEALEKTIGDLDSIKKLSVETAVSLIDFGNDTDWKERGRKIYSCGDNVTLQGKKVIAADFCRIRLCPMCQRRKSLKTYSDFKKILALLPDYAFLHLVLTVPNVKADDLAETLDYMNSCSSRFFKIKEIDKAFKGVARVTEVSYNEKTDTFHPHFHNLVAVKKSYFTSRSYLKYDTLRFLWSSVWHYRRDNLKRLTDDKIKLSNLLDSSLLQIFITKADEGALPEIAKYAVKPLNFEGTRKHRAAVLQALFEALHKRRLIQLYGVIAEAARKAKVNINADETECVDSDTLENEFIVSYNYNHRLSRYEQKEGI